MFKLRFDDAGKQIYMFPQDVIDNTILAFAVSPTTRVRLLGRVADRPLLRAGEQPELHRNRHGERRFGDCGTGSLVVTGPFFQQHDIRFAKRTAIAGNVNFEFAAEMLNAFNQAELHRRSAASAAHARPATS